MPNLRATVHAVFIRGRGRYHDSVLNQIALVAALLQVEISKSQQNPSLRHLGTSPKSTGRALNVYQTNGTTGGIRMRSILSCRKHALPTYDLKLS